MNRVVQLGMECTGMGLSDQSYIEGTNFPHTGYKDFLLVLPPWCHQNTFMYMYIYIHTYTQKEHIKFGVQFTVTSVPFKYYIQCTCI